MASDAFLITAILVVVLALLVLRLAARWLVGALIGRAPRLASRLIGSSVWQRGEPYRERLAKRHPRAFGTVAARFDPTTFTGLPLSLMVLAGVYALASLGGLVDDVRETEGVVQLDAGVNAFFGPYRAAWLLKGFLWITAIGTGPSIAAIAATATALLWSDHRRRLILPLWVTFFGAQAMTWTSKYVIARPRPTFLPNLTEWNPSFPSGHATASTALIGFVGYAVARDLGRSGARFEVAFWTTVIIGLICFSRIFLGLHFLTDVLAGILVGSFWLTVGFALAELGRRRGVEGGRDRSG